jgi:hypothetical protein
MAKYTKKEFAEKCGMATNALSVYINPKRGQVVLDEDGLVDTDNETNRRFLEKNRTKKSIKTDPVPTIASLPPNQAESDDNLLEIEINGVKVKIPSYEKSEQVVKYFDALKRDKEIQKLDLDIQKKAGEVIPTDPIETLIFQFKAQILNHDKITMQSFLNEISHKYSITSDDTAYFKGYYVRLLNNAVEEATKSFIEGLDRSLREFSVKRGVGERN